MQQHGSTYFTRRPPPLAVEVGSKKATFSEYCRVAYQIKRNDACSNSTMPLPLLDPGVESKGQNLTFLDLGHVAHQIKSNDEYSNMQTHILSLHWMGSKVIESSHVAYQIRRESREEHIASTESVLKHTLNPGVGSSVKTFFF